MVCTLAVGEASFDHTDSSQADCLIQHDFDSVAAEGLQKRSTAFYVSVPSDAEFLVLPTSDNMMKRCDTGLTLENNNEALQQRDRGVPATGAAVLPLPVSSQHVAHGERDGITQADGQQDDSSDEDEDTTPDDDDASVTDEDEAWDEDEDGDDDKDDDHDKPSGLSAHARREIVKAQSPPMSRKLRRQGHETSNRNDFWIMNGNEDDKQVEDSAASIASLSYFAFALTILLGVALI